jgi:SAM-dependent methyltransferase
MSRLITQRWTRLKGMEIEVPDRFLAAADMLTSHRRLWQQKPVLRRIYEHYYGDIVRRCVPGRTLEIGGGTGNLKGFLQDIFAIDIQFAPWLDTVADAHRLPFADRSFDNIVMFDVLHHLERPRLFLSEASRVLRPNGRLITMEPGITPVSHLFYMFFHPEPVRMNEDPLANGPLSPDRDPWDSNQGIPTLLFRRNPAQFEAAFPALKLREATLCALFAYPLSGGFRPWSLIPEGVVEPLLKLEGRLSSILGPLMAFRLLSVVERV